MLRATPAVLRSFVPVIVAVLTLVGAAACQDDGAGEPPACPFRTGDLVLTEVFAEPEGADAGNEWLEVYNASGRDLDLRGLRLWYWYNEDGRTMKRHTIDGDTPVPLAAGAYGLITNGPRRPEITWGYDELMTNIPGDGARITLVCGDGTIIDEVCFGEPCGDLAFAFPDERSWTFQAADVPSESGNDAPERWQPTRPTPCAPNPPPCLCPAPPEGATILSPGPGTLRVTELLPNPAGDDGGSEWVELYVQADGWVDLTGVRVTSDAEEPSGGHIITRGSGCTLVEGGSYVVVAGEIAVYGPAPEEPEPLACGDVAPTPTPTPADGATDGCPRLGGAFVHQVADRLSLGNASGGSAAVALWTAEGTRIDAVTYTGDHVVENRAVQLLDGPAGPEICTAGRPYDTPWTTPWSVYGSPGETNPSCGACFCVGDDDTIVEGVNPAPGELVLTEVLPDVPGSERDNDEREWFEAYLSEDAAGGRDLACLRLRKEPDDSDTALQNEKHECLHVEPGTYVVFARSRDAEVNGGLPIVHAIYPSLSLKADEGSLGLYLPDGTPLDAVENWGDSDEGVALQLDADLMDADPIAENGAPGAWCNAFVPYGDDPGQFGTPGGANFSCTACYCFDEDDGWIEAAPPLAGELAISEVFGNTPGSEDAALEWIEVTSSAASVRYLNCVALELDGEREDEIGTVHPGCAPIWPGDHAVLCADEAAAAGVGIGDCYGYDGRALKGSDTVAVSSRDDLLDTLTYEDLDDGVSWMASGDGSGLWCHTPPEVCWFACDTEDRFVGTPGESNPVCP